VTIESAVGVVAFEPKRAAVVGVGSASGVLFLAVVDDGDAWVRMLRGMYMCWGYYFGKMQVVPSVKNVNVSTFFARAMSSVRLANRGLSAFSEKLPKSVESVKSVFTAETLSYSEYIEPFVADIAEMAS